MDEKEIMANVEKLVLEDKGYVNLNRYLLDKFPRDEWTKILPTVYHKLLASGKFKGETKDGQYRL